MGRVSLCSRLILHFDFFPQFLFLLVVLLHPRNLLFEDLLRLFRQLLPARQVVIEPLLLLFSLLPQFQNFLFGARFLIYMLGEGLHCSLVGHHLGLQIFLHVFECLVCLCSDVRFPIRGLPEFIPEPAYFCLGRFGRFLCFGKSSL